MEIKKIHIENYKSIDNFSCDAFHKTLVCGKNGVGKTSLADAIVDIMCDKMTDGTSPNSIRPHEINGSIRHYVPVIREITADIDGKCYTIRKTTEEKWRRPHGATESVYDGSKTMFSVDGYEKQLKDYTEWTADHIAKPEMVSFYMNPQVFINSLRKSTTDGRKLLEKVSGFSLQDFLNSNPKYSPIADIVGENSVEDVVKQLRRNLKNQKKELETAQSNLNYESSRTLDIEPVDEGLIAKLREELATVEEEIKSTSDHNREVTEKSYTINEKIHALAQGKIDFDNAQELENSGNRNELTNRFNEISQKRDSLFDKQSSLAGSVAEEKVAINHVKDTLEELKGQKLRTVCPTCGQQLTEGQKEKIRAEHNSKVETLKVSLKAHEDFLKTYQKKLDEVTNEYTTIRDELEEISRQMNERPVEMPKPEWPKQSALDALKSELESLKIVDIYPLKEKENSLKSQIASETQKNDRNIHLKRNKEELLTNLESAVKTQANACGEIERKIDMVTEFSVKKNEALADLINPYFSNFYFSFLEYTELEGNPVETCKMIEKATKTDYMNGLNHGSRLICETELVSGFQKMNGISLPIILDDSESLDTNRIPDTEQQLFVLRRVDNRPLTVKEIRNGYIE